MLALVFDGQRRILDPAHPEPQPAPDEALIQVLIAGICATDLEILAGYAGFQGILGHEFAGRVLACPARPELVGRRVVGEINIGCGHCSTCLAGQQGHCRQRTVIGIRGRDGVFAQRLALPVENLHPLPDALTDEAAVFVEPLAAALEISQQVHIRPRDRVVVLGDGRLGQLVARSLALTGCDLVVAGRHEAKLALLNQAGIATARFADLPPGEADVVVECAGNPAAFGDALELLRPQGVLVLKSTYSGLAQADLSRVAVDEISVIGSRCGPFPPAISLLASGRVDPRPLIEAVYPLEEGLAALDHAGRPGVLKVLLRPPQ